MKMKANPSISWLFKFNFMQQRIHVDTVVIHLFLAYYIMFHRISGLFAVAIKMRCPVKAH